MRMIRRLLMGVGMIWTRRIQHLRTGKIWRQLLFRGSGVSIDISGAFEAAVVFT
jgi:hypothetical protein